MKRGGQLARQTPLKATNGFRKQNTVLVRKDYMKWVKFSVNVLGDKARKPLRKESKASISKLQRDLWAECRRIVKARSKGRCYTCSAIRLRGRNAQTGHVPWPKATLGAFLKYDLRVLRLQCGRCNIWHSGMGAEAYKRMLAEIGPEAMAQLEADRRVEVKAHDHYSRLLELYKTTVS